MVITLQKSSESFLSTDTKSISILFFTNVYLSNEFGFLDFNNIMIFIAKIMTMKASINCKIQMQYDVGTFFCIVMILARTQETQLVLSLP